MILESAVRNDSRVGRVPIRIIALPTEHGGWGFLLEPVLLGLLVAPSVAGAWLGVAALNAFLARHPLKIALNDARRGKTYARTRIAAGFATLYGLIAITAFGLALSSTSATFWWPLAQAVPFGLAQLSYDARNRSRDLVAELLGSTAMAFLAPAIAMSAGWPLERAWPLGVILAARSVASILYVRTRLRLERFEPSSRVPSLGTHLLGLVVVIGLAVTRFAPWLTVLAMTVLLVRSVYGLSSLRRRVPAKIVGFQEIGYGLLVVGLAALGYGLGV